MANVPVTVVKGLREKNKQNSKNKDNDEPRSPPELSEVDLQPDMLVLCNTFRLSDGTRAALTAYDARTLEDFAMMTVDDFQEMIVSAARLSRPLPPLQQRKVAVLLDWVHEIVEDATPVCEKEAKQEGVFAALLNGSLFDPDMKIRKLSKVMESKTTTPDYTIIPPDWESRLKKDLPLLKKKLKLLGQESRNSLLTNFVLDLRWIFCGYKR